MLSQDLLHEATMTIQKWDTGNTAGNDQKVLKGNDKGYPAGLPTVFSWWTSNNVHKKLLHMKIVLNPLMLSFISISIQILAN